MKAPLWRRGTLSIGMLALALIIGVPLYYIVINTFKTQADMVASPLGFPTAWSFENWAQVLTDPSIFRVFDFPLIKGDARTALQ